MKSKKAQGAMEYLMTYGWAILVVMIVGIVMWQLGIFSMGGATPTTSTGFNKIKPLLTLAKMDTIGNFDITFTNGAGSTISVAGASINNTADTDCTYAITTPATFPVSIASGENVHIVAAGTNCAQTAGTVYSAYINMTYDQTVGGTTLRRSDSGTIRGAYEAAI